MNEHPEAFQQLAAHRDALHRYLLGMVRDPDEAEDLTQEALLRAHLKLATLEEESRLTAWLYRIATNVARDRFRQASYRHRPAQLAEDDEDAAEAADSGPRLDKLMEQREMSDCVRGYLERLSDPFRAVILLHDVEGLTNPEIAEMLGVSLATVKIRVHRARTQLRENRVVKPVFGQAFIPVHGHKDLKLGTLRQLLKDAGLTEADL